MAGAHFEPEPCRMTNSASAKNYRLGSLYALATACLMGAQEPFSSLAARRLSSVQFVCLTQIALLLSVPLLIAPADSRRDFAALLRDRANYGKLAILFLIGSCGLLLYNFGLSNAHPIIIAAILNLSPFWAALVALLVARKAIPISMAIFFSCLAVAFAGAMMVAWSQIDSADQPTLADLTGKLLHGSWFYAIPIPVLSALSGTLIGKWFADYKETAAIAANFVASACVLIPATMIISYLRADSYSGQWPAILLLLIGTMVAASAGRVLYQISLSATDNDNGFVTMFFLLVPALASVVSIPLSWWIPDLRFVAGPMFFAGLLVIAASLLLFSLKSWR
jgi:hypothetical protein